MPLIVSRVFFFGSIAGETDANVMVTIRTMLWIEPEPYGWTLQLEKVVTEEAAQRIMTADASAYAGEEIKQCDQSPVQLQDLMRRLHVIGNFS